MARLARVIAPGFPHHITQRGNRRLPTFFRDEDYEAYLALMAEWCRTCGVEVWAYCLMPNHVHLIAVPETKEGLRALGRENEAIPPFDTLRCRSNCLNLRHRIKFVVR